MINQPTGRNRIWVLILGLAAWFVILIGVITAVNAASPGHPNPPDDSSMIVPVILGFALYLLPTIIAFRRGHPHRWLIFVINLAFGWTFVLWLVCLCWACGYGRWNRNTNINTNTNTNVVHVHIDGMAAKVKEG